MASWLKAVLIFGTGFAAGWCVHRELMIDAYLDNGGSWAKDGGIFCVGVPTLT